MQPYLATIFQLLLHRLQDAVKDSKVSKYSKLFLHSICVFALSYGGQCLHDQLESQTPGLSGMIVMNIWPFNRDQCAGGSSTDVCQMLIGSTRFLLESTMLQNLPAWKALFQSTISLVDAAEGGADSRASVEEQQQLNIAALLVDEDSAESREFDGTYSKLAYAHCTLPDPTIAFLSNSGSVNPSEYCAKALSAFCLSRPGQILPSIQSALDEKGLACLQALLQKYNVTVA